MQNKKYTFLPLILVIIFSSYYYKTNLKKTFPNSDCLEKFQICDSIYVFDSTYTNLSMNLLFARWQIRKENYSYAIDILDSLEKLTKHKKGDRLYNQVIFYKFHSKHELFELDIESIDSELTLIQDPIQIVNMLYLKSSVLREKQEVNFSYASSLYAEYLRIKLSNKNQKSIYTLPWHNHSINLIRQHADTQICRFYIQKTLAKCTSNSPACRWMNTLLLSLDNKLSENQINNIKNQVLDEDQYDPAINNLIKIHLNHVASDDEFAIKSLLSEINKSKPLNNPSNFYNSIYLIDAYLAIGDISNAKIWIDDLINTKFSNSVFQTILLSRIQQLNHLSYLNSKNKKILEEVFKNSIELNDSYIRQGKSTINEHYADAIYQSNNIFLEALFELNHQCYIPKNELLNHLNKIKSLYNKVSDSRSVLGNKIPTKESLKKINNLKQQIEQKEMKVKRYMDTIYPDMSIFEDLYFLHKKLYDLKQTLPEITESDSLSKDIKLKLSDIDAKKQIIDFIQSDSSLFLSKITSDDIKIIKLNKEQTLTAIEEKIASSKDKEIDLEQNYLDTVFSEFLSTDHSEIIFIPDGKFFEFPIELIKSNDGDYLLENYIISYASQISEAINQEEIILNKEIFTASYSSLESIKKRGTKKFPELMSGLNEVMLINELYLNTESYEGFEFTNESLQNALDHDIVHISSHSSSSTENPLDNYIMVRDEDVGAIPIYGFSLKPMDWDTKLVVLSSCESGTGTLKPGAGVFSLSRDFLQSGAETVIKTLWKVNDQSSSELMVLFHKNLKMGYTVAQALQNAKITIQEQYEHPFYWAGFVLEGNPKLKFN